MKHNSQKYNWLYVAKRQGEPLFIKAFKNFDSNKVEWTKDVEKAAEFSEDEWEGQGALDFILSENLCLISYADKPAKLEKESEQSDETPEERFFIVQDRDGHFVADVVETEWTTVSLAFKWTKKRHLAKCFSEEQLHAKGASLTLMQRIIRGHAGAESIEVEK